VSVIVPAEQLPESSPANIVEALFAEVAVVAEFGIFVSDAPEPLNKVEVRLPVDGLKVSFVLEGLNENHRPIKEATVLQAATEKDTYVHNEGDPFYEERGNGKDGGFASLKSLSQEQLTTQSLPAFLEAMFTALAKK